MALRLGLAAIDLGVDNFMAGKYLSGTAARLVWTGLFLGTASLFAADLSTPSSSVRQAPRVLLGKERGIGRFVPDLEFQDLAGKSHKLSDVAGPKGIVIAVTSTSCPLSKKYLPTLTTLAKEWSKSGLGLLLLNPTPTDKEAAVQEAAKSLGSSGLYVHDKAGTLAQALALTSTTDALLLDSARTVRYHGAVDDQYGFGYSLEAPRKHYLATAIEDYLQEKPVLISATEAPGCHLDFSTPATSTSSPVTYHNRISRIIQSNCGECHRDGGVAPFSLTTHEDLLAHAPMIETVVDQGTMPPWFAAPDKEGNPSPWINDCSLTPADKTDLLAWLKSDHPLGDPKDAPLPVKYADGWTIGEPDLVVKFPEAVPIQATGVMKYKNVVVETHLKEDKWVQAIEVRPGKPEVVHHVLVFGRPPRNAKGNSPDDEINYWGIYVPGNSKQVYQEGFARKLPKGSVIRFQMHYTPNGTATEDLTQVGFVFADEPPEHEIKTASLVNAWFEIPPGNPDYKDVAKLKLPSDVTILGFLPHMHLRGKACSYEALTPDGKTETILDIPRYDFNWQLLYQYAEPRTFTEGTILRFNAVFDNSADNPANPDPKATVRWGEQTYDEMIVGYLEYYVPTGTKPGELSSIEQHRQGISGNRDAVIFQALDQNDDSKLSLEEVKKLTENPRFKQANPLTIGIFFNTLDKDKDNFLSQEEFLKLRELLGKRKK